MNLADSTRAQDNTNKVVSEERENKTDGEECNLLHMDRMTDISVRR